MIDNSLTQYFSYRDELTVQDGVTLRAKRIVFPAQMRPRIKKKVHAGHMRINSCLRRARELVFWPGMSAQIRQFVESCNICATYSCKQSAEPLYQHPVPDRPWAKVGTYIFSIEGRDYLITTDYYSNFFEIDYLPETTSEAVITKMKHHFARHGLPDTVISDGGPQYTSGKSFSARWNFQHNTSSPGNSHQME
ncbi:uncharacterized protein K02A2.6-like [Anneissia japonica]|uniref:uncharacterized protein K02A2.6-like n=1 Tax=Anneissia japonica TaxID=1529436 RepID=UPI0014257807|nr:uncharacterized protein K02A2.6-like [Anneissia japonica]